MGDLDLRVRLEGRIYVVIDRAGVQKSGRLSSRDAAERWIDARRREAGIVSRACLSCGTAFDSEGPHNRMCDPCRSRVHSADWMSELIA